MTKDLAIWADGERVVNDCLSFRPAQARLPHPIWNILGRNLRADTMRDAGEV
jgi:hypothetical protein